MSEQGSYQDLVEQKGAFAAFLEEYMAEGAEEENEEQELSDAKENESPKKEPNKEENKDEKTSPAKGGTTLIEKEKAETGSVKLSVYLYYMKAIGLAGCIAAIFGQSMNVATQNMVSYWMTW